MISLDLNIIDNIRKDNDIHSYIYIYSYFILENNNILLRCILLCLLNIIINSISIYDLILI
jgi:hypothetical protein